MKAYILALALVSATSLSAFAGEVDFTKVDANADGLVSMEEATAAGWEWSSDDFAAADADGDGALNAAEFAAVTG